MAAPTSAAIRFTVNGEAHELAGEASVAALLARFVPGLAETRMVAVERNGEIVPRALWSATSVAAGDRIEIVRFVQGG